MLPLRVNAMSSTSCSLSEASSFLQRFLRSDGCSDSFAIGYAANVAQSLDEFMARRGGNKDDAAAVETRKRKHPHMLDPLIAEEGKVSSTHKRRKKSRRDLLDHADPSLVKTLHLQTEGCSATQPIKNEHEASSALAPDAASGKIVMLNRHEQLPCEAGHYPSSSLNNTEHNRQSRTTDINLEALADLADGYPDKHRKKKRRHSDIDNVAPSSLDEPVVHFSNPDGVLRPEKKRRKETKTEKLSDGFSERRASDNGSLLVLSLEQESKVENSQMEKGSCDFMPKEKIHKDLALALADSTERHAVDGFGLPVEKKSKRKSKQSNAERVSADLTPSKFPLLETSAKNQKLLVTDPSAVDGFPNYATEKKKRRKEKEASRV